MPADKIRALIRPSDGIPGDRTTDEYHLGGLGGAGAGDNEKSYEVGASVEYFSATASSWIPARVQTVNTDGTYNLDCKPQVPKERIRALVAGGGGGHQAVSSRDEGGSTFPAGAQVEYLSGLNYAFFV